MIFGIIINLIVLITGLIFLKLVNRIEILGDKWKLYTDNPDKLVKYLTKFAKNQGLIIVSMEICRASLEDAFVEFTESKRYAD